MATQVNSLVSTDVSPSGYAFVRSHGSTHTGSLLLAQNPASRWERKIHSTGAGNLGVPRSTEQTLVFNRVIISQSTPVTGLSLPGAFPFLVILVFLFLPISGMWVFLDNPHPAGFHCNTNRGRGDQGGGASACGSGGELLLLTGLQEQQS